MSKLFLCAFLIAIGLKSVFGLQFPFYDLIVGASALITGVLMLVEK